MIAAGIWLALVFFTMEILRLYLWGRLVSYGALGVAFIAILYLCEKVVLLDRRAFTCKGCGYDLRGLPVNRCPECGDTFDPEERKKILARIAAPPPKSRYRWIAPLVVVLLSLAVAAGMLAWQRAAARRAIPASAPTTRPGPTSTRGGR